ncbi:MAG TPA: hypothetical protein PK210_05070 [Bacteroidia bacterium]|nr:hypothetical protein [Bacteroidia bacterium]
MPTTQEQINQLRKQIQDLGLFIDQKLKTCCCKSSPHWNTHSGNLYWVDEDGVTQRSANLFFLLNDKFPLEGNCIDDKAQLFMNDCTVHATWKGEYDPNDGNSGWQEFAITMGGTVKQ